MSNPNGRKLLFSSARNAIARTWSRIMEPLPDRPPRSEMAKRAAEAGAGLAAMGHAEGVLSHWKMLRGAHDRVDDSHRWGAEALGLRTKQQVSNDDMGDSLQVTGDQQHTTINRNSNPLWPLLVGALMAGAAWLWFSRDNSDSTKIIEKPGQDYEVEVEVIPPK